MKNFLKKEKNNSEMSNNIIINDKELKKWINYWFPKKDIDYRVSVEEKITPLLKEIGFDVTKQVIIEDNESYRVLSHPICKFDCSGYDEHNQKKATEMLTHFGYNEFGPFIDVIENNCKNRYECYVLENSLHYRLLSHEIEKDNITYSRYYDQKNSFKCSLIIDEKEIPIKEDKNTEPKNKGCIQINGRFFARTTLDEMKTKIVEIKIKGKEENETFNLECEEAIKNWLLTLSSPLNINEIFLKLKSILDVELNNINAINVNIKKCNMRYTTKVDTDQIEVVNDRLINYLYTTNKGTCSRNCNGQYIYTIDVVERNNQALIDALTESAKDDMKYIERSVDEIIKTKKI